MNEDIRALVFVFAILLLIAGMRMGFAVVQPFIASVPVAGPQVAGALDYVIL